MTDRSVSVYLKANITGYSAAIAQAKLQTRDFARDAAKSAQQHRDAWDRVGKGMLITGGVIAAGIGIAIKTFADFDAQMSQVQALSHASAADMDKLTDAAMHLGAGIGFSASQVAEAETELVKAGISVKDQLGGALPGALNLAAAGQINVAEATETATIAMTQFGLVGKDIPHVADLFAAGADKALGSVDDLAMAFKQSGLVASQFGLSIDDTVGVLSAFAQNGLLGSDAGTSFKTMLQRLTPQSKQASGTMKQLGLDFYDAQGHFIGIEAVAGQLQTRLKGLSEEQRNSALQVIFGQDAIRSANVLYKEGAAGIAGWVGKVNDSGFAAQQAQAKMDNLNGDLSKLKAAFQNDLIEAGSHANGVLRNLTQTATGLLTTFSDLPAPLQEIGLGVGAATSGLLLFGGAMTLMLPRIKAAQVSLAEMGRAGGLLSRGLGGTASVMTGPWGAAIAAGAIGLGIFAKKHEEAKQRVLDLTQSLDQETGALTNATKATIFKNLADDGVIKFAKELGISLATVTDAATGSAPALASLNAQLAPFLDGQDRNAAAARALAESVGIQNGVVADATGEWQKQRAAAEDASAAGVELTDAQKALLGATDDTTGGLKDQTDTLSTLIGKLDAASGAVLGMRGANRAWFDAVQAAQDALKSNGRTLDIHTQKGRDNAAALDAMASAAVKRADAAKAGNATDAQVVRQLEAERAKLFDTARQFGLSKSAAHAYVNQVLAIPSSAKTAVGLTGYAKAIKDARALGQILRANSLQAAALYASGNAYRNPAGATGGLFTGAAFIHRSDGGPVTGRGTGTSDSVPAMLSTGEYVINASSVKAIGVQTLHALNRYSKGGSIARGAASAAGAVQAWPESMVLEVDGQRFTAYVRREAAIVTRTQLTAQARDVQAVAR